MKIMDGPNEAIIEVSIPMRYFDGDDDQPQECAICIHPMCPEDRCSHTATILTCCEQAICCGCFVKLLKRCKCTPDCREVVGVCPFCRDMCRADVSSVFLARHQACRGCRTK
jgi:hypothetical protein